MHGEIPLAVCGILSNFSKILASVNCLLQAHSVCHEALRSVVSLHCHRSESSDDVLDVDRASAMGTSIKSERSSIATSWSASLTKMLFIVSLLLLQGGLEGDVARTAFVLISLIEAKNAEALPVITVDSAITKARSFLERHLATLTDAYSIPITAYALIFSGSSKTSEAKTKLMSAAINKSNKIRVDNDDSLLYLTQTEPLIGQTQLIRMTKATTQMSGFIIRLTPQQPTSR